VRYAAGSTGVPEKDRFQRVLELSPDDFRFRNIPISPLVEQTISS
jgi:hypothetical protein